MGRLLACAPAQAASWITSLSSQQMALCVWEPTQQILDRQPAILQAEGEEDRVPLVKS